MDFKNKVVWITGASSGIGAELAIQLAGHGARLILTSRNMAKLNDIQKTCLQQTDFCELLPADLLDPIATNELTAKAIIIFGRIDIVILNAGVSQRSFATETSPSVYRNMMELNFFAPITIAQHLLPHFEKQSSGHIIAMSSMAGLMGFPLRTGYAASKHALKGFFETLQTEHSIPGLNITIVFPGRIQTPISLSAVTADGSSHNKMDTGQLNGISVKICAKKILMAIPKRKKRLLIAHGERLLWWIWFLLPNLYYKISREKGLKQ